MKVFSFLICTFLLGCYIIDSVSSDPVQKLDVEIVANINAEDRHELDKRQTGGFPFPPIPPPTNLNFKELLLSTLQRLLDDVIQQLVNLTMQAMQQIQALVEAFTRKLNKLEEFKDQLEEDLQKLAEEDIQRIQVFLQKLENAVKFLQSQNEFFQEVLELLERLQELLKVLCDDFWQFIQNLPELLKLVCDLLDLWAETPARRQMMFDLSREFLGLLEPPPNSDKFPAELASMLLAEDQKIQIAVQTSFILVQQLPTNQSFVDDVVLLGNLKAQLEDFIAIRDAACPCPRLPPIFKNVLQGIRERFDDLVKRIREMPAYEAE